MLNKDPGILFGPITAENFRQIRQYMDMKGHEMAALLGVSPESISRWENGHQAIDKRTYALAALMSIDFFDGKDFVRSYLKSLGG